MARFLFLVLLCALLTAHAAVPDSGFAGGVTPSRFELSTQPGQVVRRSLEIYNLGSRPQRFNVKTVDWDYSEEGQISFSDVLTEQSCREWVRLERLQVSVVADPQRPRSFRFEIHVPEAAPARECRFALMIESVAAGYEASFGEGALSLPVTGRIAVVVYLRIGDVAADLQFGEIAVRTVNNRNLPAIAVRNTGQAHGRLDADLDALSESGDRVRLSIATSPILPGQTRYLALTPESGKSLQYPVRVTGKIYSDEHSFEVDERLPAPPEQVPIETGDNQDD